MHFPFYVEKATEVAAFFLERSGGSIKIMKLVKLVYLLDRLSVEKRGLPVVGGWYISMKNGPVTSELLDFINAGQFDEEETGAWKKCIEDRKGHFVRLLSVPERDYVSDGELALLEEIWATHGHKDQWQLRDWCHVHCPEWTPLTTGRKEILIEEMGEAVGQSAEAIARTREEAYACSQFDALLT